MDLRTDLGVEIGWVPVIFHYGGWHQFFAYQIPMPIIQIKWNSSWFPVHPAPMMPLWPPQIPRGQGAPSVPVTLALLPVSIIVSGFFPWTQNALCYFRILSIPGITGNPAPGCYLPQSATTKLLHMLVHPFACALFWWSGRESFDLLVKHMRSLLSHHPLQHSHILEPFNPFPKTLQGSSLPYLLW